MLEKVHQELNPNQKDLDFFDSHLKTLQTNGSGFNDLCSSAYINPSVNSQNDVTNFLFKKTITSSEEFSPIFGKLFKKTELEKESVWLKINDCLYQENENTFKLEGIKNICDGLALKKINLYDKICNAIECLSLYVNEIWTSADFTHIINLCKTNEKFVYLLLYPYFIKPLGSLVWPTLLSHFHFVSGSFTMFMQKVSSFLKKGSSLSHSYRMLTVRKSTKLVFGFGGVGLFTLFNKFLTSKTNDKLLISNRRVYGGLNGALGSGISLFKKEGSRVVFDVFCILSTFTNAAVAGALEPKRELINKDFILDIIKKIRK